MKTMMFAKSAKGFVVTCPGCKQSKTLKKLSTKASCQCGFKEEVRLVPRVVLNPDYVEQTMEDCL